MSKDFDAARKAREEADRTFVIGGETFTYKAAVAPETILMWNDATSSDPDMGEHEWLALIDATIVAILADGQSDKWEKVRDPKATHPLNVGDIREVLTYLIAEATGRPTGEPSGSSDGSPKNGTGSKVASSPTAVPSPA